VLSSGQDGTSAILIVQPQTAALGLSGIESFDWERNMAKGGGGKGG
jgi:hypothetical protein